MGVFLQTLILKGSTTEDFIQALPELVTEHPEMNLGSGSYRYHRYADGIGILCHYNVVGYEDLAEALSKKLRRSVMLLYIYDDDQWGYYLYDNGRKLDCFSPSPDYFTGNESETEKYKGNAQIVAQHFGVSPQAIEAYLVRWTEQVLEGGEKAYSNDKCTYGDCWQMTDFMSALRCPYAFDEQPEPANAQAPPPAAASFDTALITNNLERWIADTYVMWSCRGGGNWELFGGYPKSEDNAAILQNILERDWSIKNLVDGIQTVNLLITDEPHKTPATDGWDFCRGMQLIGVFYVVGYIDRAQMIEYSCTIGKVMQRHFNSWETLCESYLAGHAEWCRRTFNSVEAEESIAERRAIYEKLKKMKDGPYRLPWNMPLTPTATENSAAMPGTSENYFEQWLVQEEKWIEAYRHKARKMLLLIIMPLTLIVLGVFMAVMGMINGGRGIALLGFAVTGIQVGLLVTLPVYFYVMHALKKGRISSVIRKTVKFNEMDEREQEALGMEMLYALQTHSCRLDYQDKAPHSQTTPARLLVSKNYFYQTGSRMFVILIRRRDVEYIEVGKELSAQFTTQHAISAQSTTLHAIYFYYRSSRERRLEGNKGPDNGMGFFDSSIRDKAFGMIDREMKKA